MTFPTATAARNDRFEAVGESKYSLYQFYVQKEAALDVLANASELQQQQFIDESNFLEKGLQTSTYRMASVREAYQRSSSSSCSPSQDSLSPLLPTAADTIYVSPYGRFPAQDKQANGSVMFNIEQELDCFRILNQHHLDIPLTPSNYSEIVAWTTKKKNETGGGVIDAAKAATFELHKYTAASTTAKPSSNSFLSMVALVRFALRAVLYDSKRHDSSSSSSFLYNFTLKRKSPLFAKLFDPQTFGQIGECHCGGDNSGSSNDDCKNCIQFQFKVDTLEEWQEIVLLALPSELLTVLCKSALRDLMDCGLKFPPLFRNAKACCLQFNRRQELLQQQSHKQQNHRQFYTHPEHFWMDYQKLVLKYIKTGDAIGPLLFFSRLHVVCRELGSLSSSSSSSRLNHTNGPTEQPTNPQQQQSYILSPNDLQLCRLVMDDWVQTTFHNRLHPGLLKWKQQQQQQKSKQKNNNEKSNNETNKTNKNNNNNNNNNNNKRPNQQQQQSSLNKKKKRNT